ncbi:MAG: hypothetical protein RMK20_13210 [Verrucomicrobiales bacterium]|nr:hypothetical protein [Verrucomicrobiales bacterium]
MKMRTGFCLLVLCIAGCATTNPIEARKQERAAAYAALPPETRALVDAGQIRTGMSEDAVYIAWGRPHQIAQQQDANGLVTVWIYEGGWMQETRYWSGWRRPRLERDYFPRTYVRAEVVFRDGRVVSWRTLPQPVE